MTDDFVTKFEEFYEGGIEQVNFGKAVEVVEQINNFIAEVTRNKINNIVTEDDFTEDDFNEISRIVLINAIYFKGRWDEEFSSYETKDACFYMAPGKTKKAKMMQRLILQREYSETDEFQFLTLDYLNCDLSMRIILPRKRYGLADVITNLTINELMKHLTKKEYVEVIVKMPKFEVKTQFDAIETLKGMGIKDLFDTNSNLEGMSNFKEILISSILHSAYICTDEKGTEAAAITVKDLIGYGRCPPHPPPKEFTADHPFMYLITDSQNNIYFCGVVSGAEFEDGINGSVHQKMEEKISKNSVISFAKKIFGKRP
uniref:Serpin domain-containing protein n=1 Tax=Panagrolaimus davidi TaxID=227884 RepID=A0A914P3X5_9BILA